MTLIAHSLTREAFAPFGDVIETDGAHHFPINENTTERFHDLASIDVGSENGRVLVNIFVGQPRPRPLVIKMLERHPLGTQAFVPLQGQSYLVVVAENDSRSQPGALRIFRAGGQQGINYRRGTWHHPLLVLERDSRFLVIDRGGPGSNIDEFHLSAPIAINL